MLWELWDRLSTIQAPDMALACPGHRQTSETRFLTRTQALPGDAYQEAVPPIFLVTSATEFLASSKKKNAVVSTIEDSRELPLKTSCLLLYCPSGDCGANLPLIKQLLAPPQLEIPSAVRFPG